MVFQQEVLGCLLYPPTFGPKARSFLSTVPFKAQQSETPILAKMLSLPGILLHMKFHIFSNSNRLFFQECKHNFSFFFFSKKNLFHFFPIIRIGITNLPITELNGTTYPKTAHSFSLGQLHTSPNLQHLYHSVEVFAKTERAQAFTLSPAEVHGTDSIAGLSRAE